jgi:putative peptidoglycan lipid II flippase
MPKKRRGAADVRLLRTMFRLAPWTFAVQAGSFVSSIALAWVLGAGTGTDAYFVGLSIPVLVYSVLLVAVRSGVIALLPDLPDSDDAAFNRASSQIVSAMLAASFVCSLALTAGALFVLPPLLGGSEHFAFLTRITILELAPLGVLGALTGVFGALLAVRGIFAPQVAVMAIEPVLKTALTLTLGDRIGAQALIAGNLIGSSAAAIVLWRFVRREGILIRIGRPVNTPLVRNVIAMSAPLLVSSSILQTNPVVDRTMAADIGRGSVTALELGLRLFVVPTTLLTATLVTPLTATWAARRLRTGWPALQESLGRIVTVLSMTLPPIIVLGFLLRHELVSAIYHGGAYQASAVHATARVFGVLLLSLPAQICSITLATLFVVHRETIFNMKIGIANVVLNVVLNWALRPSLGVAGIALSTTITLTILGGVYIAGVRKRWGGLAAGVVRSSAMRVTASVAVTTFVGLAVLRLLPASSTRAGLLLIVALVVMAGLAAHGAVLLSERRLVPWLVARLGHIQRAEVLEP